MTHRFVPQEAEWDWIDWFELIVYEFTFQKKEWGA